MVPEVDDILWRWADYMRERADFGLGYPRRNIIHRAMKEGAGASQKGRPTSADIPDDIEQVECAVCAMPDHLRNAVWRKYMRRLLDKQSAQELGVSISAFRLRIDQAHYWISGRISYAA